jgi:biopolymer transport protein ExbD
VTLDGLKSAVEAQFGNANAVYIRADAKTVWDAVAQVIAAAGAAGFQVNMVTAPEESKKGTR